MTLRFHTIKLPAEWLDISSTILIMAYCFIESLELQILGYVDEDWEWCVDSGRSATSFCFFLGSYLISWCVKKQQTTFTRPSSEAEYKSPFYCNMRITMVIVYLLKDLHMLASDNQFYIVILKFYTHASNHVFNERTKNLEIGCHLVREKVLNDVLRLFPISNEEQLVYFLTKSIVTSKVQFFHFQTWHDQHIHVPACGRLIEKC